MRPLPLTVAVMGDGERKPMDGGSGCPCNRRGVQVGMDQIDGPLCQQPEQPCREVEWCSMGDGRPAQRDDLDAGRRLQNRTA